MPPLDLLLPFLVASVLVTVIPGADMALVTRQVFVGGPAPRRAFLQGLISTVLNPKPALFFLTFLPQFVELDAPVLPQTMSLVAIHVVVGLIWLSAYARLVHRARGVLASPRAKKEWLERTTGAVLIAFRLRVAVERR